MTTTKKDLYTLLDGLERDARAVIASTTKARSMISAMEWPTQEEGEFVCKSCTRKFRTERILALHVQNVHDGPTVPMSPEEEAA